MILLNGVVLNFELFPNNETRVDGEQISGLLSPMYNTVTMKYQSDADLIRLMFVKRFLDECHAKETVLVVSYMPYSRMDRRELKTTVFTLKYVADFINSLGFNEVMVLEPHSDVTPALIDNVYAIYPTVDYLDHVAELVGLNKKTDFIFFPDAGAQKRYSKVKGYKTLVGHKHRDFETGRIESLEVIGEFTQDSKILIVDDLCSYGGTFMASAQELKMLGAGKIFLFVTHCENSIHKGQILKSGMIDKVITTDSLLDPCGEVEKIHVIEIVGGVHD